MISDTNSTPSSANNVAATQVDTFGQLQVLVRYGAVPEVARCAWPVELHAQRHACVVVQTHRGLELGTIVESVSAPVEPGHTLQAPSFEVLRLATPDDQRIAHDLQQRAQREFQNWVDRIDEWKLDLQLIELEWTLDDSKLILYVLNERGPECTKLALQAAAAGLGLIEVQPVGSEGPMAMPQQGGGCGSCGCH